MRRTLTLLLPLFLLVCAQGAGLMHGIGHGSAPRAPALAGLHAADAPGVGAFEASGRPAAPETTEGSCEKCFQFAHFSGGSTPPALRFQFAETVEARVGGPQFALIARDAPASRSRGPPNYL